MGLSEKFAMTTAMICGVSIFDNANRCFCSPLSIDRITAYTTVDLVTCSCPSEQLSLPTQLSRRVFHIYSTNVYNSAHLYGYSSDICRTFFPPFLAQPSSTDIVPASIAHKIAVWEVVSAAQFASFTMLKPNNTAASVDIAARDVISAAGYGDYFTHRVGHGIGIKAHESPYLNQGNVETRLRAGMVFTSEPGIYLVEQFGARTEDVLLVKEDGEVDILSGTLAKGPWNP